MHELLRDLQVMATLLQDAQFDPPPIDSSWLRADSQWTATDALNTIDSYLRAALHVDMHDSDPLQARAPLVILLRLQMTTCDVLPQQCTSRHQQAGQGLDGQLQQYGEQQQQHEVPQQPQHQAAADTGVDASCRRAQLFELAENLSFVRSRWGVGFFPAAHFDASVRQHALWQLAACIQLAGEVGPSLPTSFQRSC